MFLCCTTIDKNCGSLVAGNDEVVAASTSSKQRGRCPEEFECYTCDESSDDQPLADTVFDADGFLQAGRYKQTKASADEMLSFFGHVRLKVDDSPRETNGVVWMEPLTGDDTPLVVLRWREWVKASVNETLESSQSPALYNGALISCQSDSSAEFRSSLHFAAPSAGMVIAGKRTEATGVNGLLCAEILRRQGSVTSRQLETITIIHEVAQLEGTTVYSQIQPVYHGRNLTLTLYNGGWSCVVDHIVHGQHRGGKP